jgi:hypothetical protein
MLCPFKECGQQPCGDGMAKLPQALSNRELHERLTRLEAENAALTARVVELEKRATKSDGFILRLSKQVGGILENIGSMDMELMGLLTKVFPDYFRTRGQITKIFAPTDRTGQQEKNQPD